MKIIRSIALGALLVLTTTAPLAAQSLSELQSRYQQDLIRESRPVLLEFLAELQTLERNVAAKADYEQAVRIAERRLKVMGDLAMSGPVTGTYALTADDSATTLRNESGGIGPWTISGTEARWEVPRIRPGKFVVLVQYRSAASRFLDSDDVTVPRMEFGEQTSLGESEVVSFSLPSTKGLWKLVRVGVLPVARNGATLRLRQTRNANLTTRIAQILLLPADGTGGGIVEAAAPQPSNLVALREAHLRRMRDLMATPCDDYARKLREVAAGAGDGSTAANNAAAEIQRVEQAAADPSTWYYASLGGAPGATGTGGPQKLARLRGATLVASSTHCGSTFEIIHEGKTIPVKLLLIDCAAGPNASQAAAYFGIPGSRIEDLSEEAARFTEKYLRGKSFTFATEWRQTPDGRYEGSVILPGVGSLQRILIGRGLAMVRELDEYSTRSDSYLRETLIALEEDARSTSRGAWGLAKAP